MIRVLHSADLHLDSPFVGMTDDPAEILRPAADKALVRLVDKAIAEKVDLVTIAGDVYDLADHGLHAQVKFNQQLRRLTAAGIPCGVVAGNHDPLDRRRRNLELPAGCKLFGPKAEVWELSSRAGHPLRLYGISYAENAVRENLAEGLTAAWRDFPRPGLSLALLHANVGGRSGHENYAPCSLAQLVAAPFDAWLLGHVHEGKVLSAAAPLVLYPGNLQGRHILEDGAKGAWLIEFSDSGAAPPALTFVSLAPVRWVELSCSIDGLETFEALFARMDGMIEALPVDDDAGLEAWIVRWHLVGRGSLHQEIAKVGAEEMAAVIGSYFAARRPRVLIEKLRDRTSPALPLDQLRRQEGFPALVIESADQLLSGSDDNQAADELFKRLTEILSTQPFCRLLPELGLRLRTEPQFFADLISRGLSRALDELRVEKN